MALLSRLSILTKIIAIIAVIGIVTMCGTWFAAGRITRINDGYVSFIQKDAQAWVLTPQIARNILQLRYLMYRMISEPMPAELKKIETDIGATFAENADLIKRLKELAPGHAASADALTADVAKLRKAAEPAVEAAMSGLYDEALRVQSAEVKPLFDKLVADSTALREGFNKSINQGADGLTAETDATVVLVIAVLGAGLLIGVLFGGLIAVFGIARPLKKLGDSMQALAKGAYEQAIPGLERRKSVV